MQAKLKLMLCSCGRHAYFADPETGERIHGCGDMFSQDAALEVAQMIFKTRKEQVSPASIEAFRVALLGTPLPPEVPAGFDELLQLDNRLDVASGIMPDTEEEMVESIHEFLDTFFPSFQSAARVVH